MKTIKISIQVLVMMFALLFTACNKDDETYNPPSETIISTSVGGLITDINGEVVIGATVSIEGNYELTDDNGVFLFTEIEVPKSRTYVKVEKSGYFLGSRTIVALESGINQVTITLIPMIEIGQVNSAAGGLVNVPGGASILFPTDAVRLESGGAYSGGVHVAAFYLDPNDDATLNTMPGNLEAIDASGDEQALVTYGMIAVELLGDNGEELQLDNGKEATISLPVTNSSAPSTIPLWHFDEVDGIWREEGSASLVGNMYIGNVKHFSFWNCDAPFPLVEIDGKIKDTNNNPLASVGVRIRTTGGLARGAATNPQGEYGGKVPQNVALTLEVIDICGSVIHSQAIGPLSSNTTIPDIIVTLSTNIAQMTGVLLDCNGNNVQNGYVKIKIGTNLRTIHFVQNGNFSIPVMFCNQTSVSVQGFDPVNLKESLSVVYTYSPTINAGNITVCNTLAEYITYTYGGNTYTLVDPDGGLDMNYTIIRSQGANGVNSAYLLIDGSGIGTHNLVGDSSFYDGTSSIYYDGTSGATATITTYGAVGQNIIGTFSGTFKDNQSNFIPVTGSFRMIRDN